jgi:hypothetical protein
MNWASPLVNWVPVAGVRQPTTVSRSRWRQGVALRGSLPRPFDLRNRDTGLPQEFSERVEPIALGMATPKRAVQRREGDPVKGKNRGDSLLTASRVSAGGQRAVEGAGGVLPGGRPHPVRPGPSGARHPDRGVLRACLLPTGVGVPRGDLRELVRPGSLYAACGRHKGTAVRGSSLSSHHRGHEILTRRRC